MSRRHQRHYAHPQDAVIFNSLGQALFCEGTTVPSNAATNYSPGCIYVDTDATDKIIWENVGTATSAKWVPLGGRISSQVAAGTAHSNSTDEALIGSYSIPANTLWAGAVISVDYQGIATATNAADTLTVKLYIGGLAGTALLTGTATDVANDNIFAGHCDITIRTIGASGTFVAFGFHTDVPAASGTATIGICEITASTAIDTTAAQVVGVGADWSAADPGNSCRLDILNVFIR